METIFRAIVLLVKEAHTRGIKVSVSQSAYGSVFCKGCGSIVFLGKGISSYTVVKCNSCTESSKHTILIKDPIVNLEMIKRCKSRANTNVKVCTPVVPKGICVCNKCHKVYDNYSCYFITYLRFCSSCSTSTSNTAVSEWSNILSPASHRVWHLSKHFSLKYAYFNSYKNFNLRCTYTHFSGDNYE